jgi:hypothetical protein
VQDPLVVDPYFEELLDNPPARPAQEKDGKLLVDPYFEGLLAKPGPVRRVVDGAKKLAGKIGGNFPGFGAQNEGANRNFPGFGAQNERWATGDDVTAQGKPVTQPGFSPLRVAPGFAGTAFGMQESATQDVRQSAIAQARKRFGARLSDSHYELMGDYVLRTGASIRDVFNLAGKGDFDTMRAAVGKPQAFDLGPWQQADQEARHGKPGEAFGYGLGSAQGAATSPAPPVVVEPKEAPSFFKYLEIEAQKELTRKGSPNYVGSEEQEQEFYTAGGVLPTAEQRAAAKARQARSLRTDWQRQMATGPAAVIGAIAKAPGRAFTAAAAGHNPDVVDTLAPTVDIGAYMLPFLGTAAMAVDTTQLGAAFANDPDATLDALKHSFTAAFDPAAPIKDRMASATQWAALAVSAGYLGAKGKAKWDNARLTADLKQAGFTQAQAEYIVRSGNQMVEQYNAQSGGALQRTASRIRNRLNYAGRRETMVALGEAARPEGLSPYVEQHVANMAGMDGAQRAQYMQKLAQDPQYQQLRAFVDQFPREYRINPESFRGVPGAPGSTPAMGGDGPPAPKPSGGAPSLERYAGGTRTYGGGQDPPAPKPDPPTPSGIVVSAQAGAPSGKTVAMTPDTKRWVDVEFELVEMKDLILSHDMLGRENPLFPQEWQNRDRGKKPALDLARDRAAELEPRALLLDFLSTDRGTPILHPENNVVISGNGRGLSLDMARRFFAGTTWKAYQDQLKEMYPEAAGMFEPVLVRRLKGQYDPETLAEIARVSNASGVARLSTYEEAANDAATLPDHFASIFEMRGKTLADALESPANRELVNKIVNAMPKQEASAIFDSDGNLSEAGRARLGRAVLAKIFGDDAKTILERYFEEGDFKRIVGGMEIAAGDLADLAVPKNDVSAELKTKLIEGIKMADHAIHQKKLSPRDWFRQGGFVKRDPDAMRIGQFLVDSGSKEAIALGVSKLIRAAEDAEGGMFGDDMALDSVAAVIRAVFPEEAAADLDDVGTIEVKGTTADDLEPNAPDDSLPAEFLTIARQHWPKRIPDKSEPYSSGMGPKQLTAYEADAVARVLEGAGRKQETDGEWHAYTAKLGNGETVAVALKPGEDGKHWLRMWKEAAKSAEAEGFGAWQAALKYIGQPGLDGAYEPIKMTDQQKGWVLGLLKQEGELWAKTGPGTWERTVDGKLRTISVYPSPDGPAGAAMLQITQGEAAAAPVAVPTRSAWGETAPHAFVMNERDSAQRKTQSPDLKLAKAGDADAAARLVAEHWNQHVFEQLYELAADAIVVPVVAKAAEGTNAIPIAYAHRIAQVVGQLNTDIVKTNLTARTGRDAAYRLTTHSTFDGPVIAGRRYVVVDDYLTQGGTVADLKGYIEARGGKVVAITTLQSSPHSSRLAPTDAQIKELRRAYPGLEDVWTNETGNGFEGLTYSEAHALLGNPELANTIRDRGFVAARAAHSRPPRPTRKAKGPKGTSASRQEGLFDDYPDDDFELVPQSAGPSRIGQQQQKPEQASLDVEPEPVPREPSPYRIEPQGRINADEARFIDAVNAAKDVRVFLLEVNGKPVEYHANMNDGKDIAKIKFDRVGPHLKDHFVAGDAPPGEITYRDIELRQPPDVGRQIGMDLSKPQKSARDRLREKYKDGGDDGVTLHESDISGDYETRPDATEAVVQAGVEAVRALARPSAGAFAQRVASDFARKGGSELIGKTVTMPVDMAMAAQVLRDPRFETMRFFFIKSSKIIAHTAYSQRLPSIVRSFPGTSYDLMSWLIGQMKATGADGVYLLHNHPSGDPTPSLPDASLSQLVGKWLEDWHGKGTTAFLGHVVIDHTRFAYIDGDGKYRLGDLPKTGADPVLAKNPHPLVGAPVTSPPTFAAIGGMLINDKGYGSALIGRTVGKKLAFAMDVPTDVLTDATARLGGASRFAGLVRKAARMQGATDVTLVIPADAKLGKRELDAVRNAIETNLLLDVVLSDGTSLANKYRWIDKNYWVHGRDQRIAPVLEETPAGPRRATLRNPTTGPDAQEAKASTPSRLGQKKPVVDNVAQLVEIGRDYPVTNYDTWKAFMLRDIDVPGQALLRQAWDKLNPEAPSERTELQRQIREAEAEADKWRETANTAVAGSPEHTAAMHEWHEAAKQLQELDNQLYRESGFKGVLYEVDPLDQDLADLAEVGREHPLDDYKAWHDAMVKDIGDPGEGKLREVYKYLRDGGGHANRLPETDLPDKPRHAYTLEEFARRIDELTKIARAGGANVFKDLRSRKFAGLFHHPNRKFRRGRIRLQQSLSPAEFADTLAHEVGHQLDSIISSGPRKVGGHPQGPTTGDLGALFGVTQPNALAGLFNVKGQLAIDLIFDELVEVTRALVGRDVAEDDPGYYYKPQELFARFMQSVMFHPNIIEAKAPHAYIQFLKQAERFPTVADYLDIAKGAVLDRPVQYMWLPDARQQRIGRYGWYLGTKVYGEEVIYRARRAKALAETADLIKLHFKGVKDNPERLFTAAEGVLVTIGGNPTFGTKIHRKLELPKGLDYGEVEAAWLGGGFTITNDKLLQAFFNELEAIKAAGYDLMGLDPDDLVLFEKWRVTPQDAQMAFDALSPAGQDLIRDYTADINEAKDIFNREMAKEFFGIDAEIEGYVHHYWDENALAQWRRKFLKERRAAATLQREEKPGFVKDLKKATAKALSELQIVKEWNEFVSRQLALVAEPLPPGVNRPTKPGWVAIEGDLLTGLKALGEDRTILLKEDGTSFLLQRGKKYQVPSEIYETYIKHGPFGEEITQTMRTLNSLNRYWQGNILLHPGTAATNAISGALQFTAYALEGFYKDLLGGEFAMPRTRSTIAGAIETLTPRGWQAAPDWSFGGDNSLFYSQFFGPSQPGAGGPLDKSIDALLAPYKTIERYFKKAIVNAEVRQSGQADPFEDPEFLKAVNDVVDLYAYDYQNVPFWLQQLKQHPAGGLTKPFMTYPYKYAKMLASMMGGAFDKNLSRNDRLAKLLAIGTIMALYALYKRSRQDPQKVGSVAGYDSETDTELKLKSVVNPRGRLYIGQDSDGNDVFLRTAKYPFLNFYDMLESAYEGDIGEIGQIMNDQLGTIGPLGKATLNQFGYSGEFDKFKTKETMHTETGASFIPLGRIVRDMAEFMDPKKRDLPNSPATVLGQYAPTRDAKQADRLHGPQATAQVPLRPDEMQLIKVHNYPAAIDLVGKRLGPEAAKELEGIISRHRTRGEGVGNTTLELSVPKHDMDVLTKMLGGIIIKRIDREWYERFKLRAIENKGKREAKKAAEALTGKEPPSGA